jgi:hypothetical protein
MNRALGPNYGQVYFRKGAENFGRAAFLSAREIEHGRFRALFAGTFCPKMQNGRSSPKNQKRFTTEITEATEQRDWSETYAILGSPG